METKKILSPLVTVAMYDISRTVLGGFFLIADLESGDHVGTQSKI